MKNNLLKEITQVVFFTAVVFFSSYYFVPGVANAINTINEGFQVFYGNYVDINNIYGSPCKRVLVGYTDSNKYFVPTKTITEWDKFNENKPDTIGVVDCPVDPCTSSFNYMGQTLNGIYVGDSSDPNQQCWLEQNLNIGATTTGAWGTDNGIIEKRCYGDLANNCDSWGAFYSFLEAMNYPTYENGDYSSDGQQGICPPGWHVPTDTEYNMMFQLQGVPNNSNCTVTGSFFPGTYGIEYPKAGYYNNGWLSRGSIGYNLTSAYDATMQQNAIIAEFASSVTRICNPVIAGGDNGTVRCIKDKGIYTPPGGGAN